MATTLSVNQIKAVLQTDFQNVLTLGNTQNAATDTYSKTLTNGTGAAGTADLFYCSQTTLAGGATLNLDLAGSLLDFFGNTITMARVKVMKIESTTDTSSSSVLIGDHASPWATWLAGTNPARARPQRWLPVPGLYRRNGLRRDGRLGGRPEDRQRGRRQHRHPQDRHYRLDGVSLGLLQPLSPDQREKR